MNKMALRNIVVQNDILTTHSHSDGEHLIINCRQKCFGTHLEQRKKIKIIMSMQVRRVEEQMPMTNNRVRHTD